MLSFSETQDDTVQHQIKALQSEFEELVGTMTLPYDDFKLSLERVQNYYRTNTEKPFCTAYIDPKLSKIRQQFSRYYDPVEPLRDDISDCSFGLRFDPLRSNLLRRMTSSPFSEQKYNSILVRDANQGIWNISTGAGHWRNYGEWRHC